MSSTHSDSPRAPAGNSPGPTSNDIPMDTPMADHVDHDSPPTSSCRAKIRVIYVKGEQPQSILHYVSDAFGFVNSQLNAGLSESPLEPIIRVIPSAFSMANAENTDLNFLCVDSPSVSMISLSVGGLGEQKDELEEAIAGLNSVVANNVTEKKKTETTEKGGLTWGMVLTIAATSVICFTSGRVLPFITLVVFWVNGGKEIVYSAVRGYFGHAL